MRRVGPEPEGGSATRTPGRPVVTWDARADRLDLWNLREPGSRLRAMGFSSPVWVDFRGDEVVSVDLLSVPDGMHRTARDGPGLWSVSYDTGWLWIALSENRATARLAGCADVEVLLDGWRLAAVRARLAEPVRRELSL